MDLKCDWVVVLLCERLVDLLRILRSGHLQQKIEGWHALQSGPWNSLVVMNASSSVLKCSASAAQGNAIPKSHEKSADVAISA